MWIESMFLVSVSIHSQKEEALKRVAPFAGSERPHLIVTANPRRFAVAGTNCWHRL